MKKLALFVLCAATIGFVGCDHSTNNQPVPTDAGISITTPSQDQFVEGTVNISATTKDVGEHSVEFYVNGRLVKKCTSAPWTCSWNTAGLASNSSHTLTAVAYTDLQAYTTSQPVIVKIK